MAVALENWRDRLEQALEKPFYEAEMARTSNRQVKGNDLLIVTLASLTLICLGLFI